MRYLFVHSCSVIDGERMKSSVRAGNCCRKADSDGICEAGTWLKKPVVSFARGSVTWRSVSGRDERACSSDVEAGAPRFAMRRERISGLDGWRDVEDEVDADVDDDEDVG